MSWSNISNIKYQITNITFAASTGEEESGGESKFREHNAATLLLPAQQNKHHISHFKFHTETITNLNKKRRKYQVCTVLWRKHCQFSFFIA